MVPARVSARIVLPNNYEDLHRTLVHDSLFIKFISFAASNLVNKDSNANGSWQFSKFLYGTTVSVNFL